MNIRMYEYGFGDCFRLENEGYGDLYVDFGIHSDSMSQKNREDRYDLVMNDITDDSDFLLTHYHEDHYAGAIYMMGKKKKFRNVYIPDIWRIAKSIDVIKLTLLRGLMTKSVLKNNVSVITFLQSICYSAGKVYFVKRNTEIQNKYIALWPDENYVNTRTKKMLQSLGVSGDNWERLSALAERLNTIVLRLVETEGLEEKIGIAQQLEELDAEYQQLGETLEMDKNLQHKLSKYGNQISIVFQNKSTQDRKVLFTGDVGKKRVWSFIEKNKDGKIAMHDKYEVIKVPHHGTTPYYHVFSGKSNAKTIFLIPNGKIKYSTWYVDKRYSRVANQKKCKVVCSDNKACNAATPKCKCINATLIRSAGYLDM